jgi:methylenetetrahydrofolate reductase (NADPH)
MSRRKEQSAPAHLLEHPRFELLPIKGITEQALLLPPDATITVTCSQDLGIGATLRASKRLTQRGFQVVPHIAARLVSNNPDENNPDLRTILEELQNTGIREIFVPGGDVEEPLGEFHSSLELLYMIMALGYSFDEIGVASYPDGHPLIDDDILLEALKAKQAFATYMVTQICFDPKVIVRWLENMRAEGVTLPVYIGILGILPRRKILDIGIRIGVLPDPSSHPWEFMKQIIRFWKILIDPKGLHPDKIIKGLAPYLCDEGYNILGFHIYTFNRVEPTENWRKELVSSKIKNPKKGEGYGKR